MHGDAFLRRTILDVVRAAQMDGYCAATPERVQQVAFARARFVYPLRRSSGGPQDALWLSEFALHTSIRIQTHLLVLRGWLRAAGCQLHHQDYYRLVEPEKEPA